MRMATKPRSGPLRQNWLKALSFCQLTQSEYPSTVPLLSLNLSSPCVAVRRLSILSMDTRGRAKIVEYAMSVDFFIPLCVKFNIYLAKTTIVNVFSTRNLFSENAAILKSAEKKIIVSM